MIHAGCSDRRAFFSPAGSAHPEPGAGCPGSRRLDILFVVLLSLLPVCLGLASFSFGISWDEPDHEEYGRLVLQYYLSGFQDTRAFGFKLNYLNGGVFDACCTLFQRLTPFLEPYDARHLFNSLAGALTISCAALFARRLYGTLAGILVIVFLVLSPRFLGDCMNNPKDLPFAGLYCLSLYALSFARAKYPFFTWRTAAFVVAAMALLLNVRAGGLLLFGYAGLYLLVLVWRDPESWTWRRLSALAAGYLLACLAVLVLGTLFWPWAQQNPFWKPIEALQRVGSYPWAGTIAFGGQAVSSNAIPWDYIPRLYLLTTPLSVLAGLALVLPQAAFDRAQRGKLAALSFATVFPVFWVIVTKAVLYDGLRHLLFVYPP